MDRDVRVRRDQKDREIDELEYERESLVTLVVVLNSLLGAANNSMHKYRAFGPLILAIAFIAGFWVGRYTM